MHDRERLLPADHLAFWGKSAPIDCDGASYHPVAYHLLDVAAVAEALLRAQSSRVASLARLCCIDEESLLRTVPFLVGIHDLGKYSACFQAKVLSLWPTELLGPIAPVPDITHGAITQRYLSDPKRPIASIFRGIMPAWLPGAAYGLASSIGGHHGIPMSNDDGAPWDRAIGSAQPYAEAAAAELRDVIRPVPIPEISERGEKVLSWTLSGLCVLCDWIGSDSAVFRPHAPTLTMAEYFERARNLAREAVDRAGLREAPLASHGPAGLLPDIASAFSPVQRWAAECELPEGPSVTIVEDATGSGKTEAALILTLRLMQRNGLAGAYFALPTMATANAMYARLEAAYRRLYAGDATPSLALAHGRRDLHPGFSRVALGDAGRDRSAAGDCADWIRDDRRKAFLAQIGAGTIDQALLAVLPSRHQSLRLWGLSDKVLVVDEAHAYDAYMSRELEGLLEFHAALGGSAVVLSATLPTKMRTRLANAFRKGLGLRPSWKPARQAYPLATLVAAGGAEERALELRDGLERDVQIDFAPDVPTALAEAVAAAQAGAAVLVIRNTVDEAVATADEIRAIAPVPVHLFHARFAMSDRQRIEADVLARWGKEGRTELPRNAILVATQIVEQSLDIDFDLAITDLAPVDLLIQRAGRVWRHLARRPAADRPVAGPRMIVVSPTATPDDQAGWLAGALPKTGFIYRDPRILWRTARALQATGRLRIRTTLDQANDPASGRRLVENVYEEAEPPTPAAIDAAAIDAEGKAQGDRARGGQVLLKLDDGYTARGAWSNEPEVATRLDVDTRTMRLARRTPAGIVPWAHSEASPRRAWALSEVSVAASRLTHGSEGVDEIRKEWGRYEEEMPLVVLDELPNGSFSGSASKDGVSIKLLYDSSRGLRFA